MAWVASNKVLSAKATLANASKPQQQRSSRSSLSLYLDPPSHELALEEFERFALDRLKRGFPPPHLATTKASPSPCPTPPHAALHPPPPPVGVVGRIDAAMGTMDVVSHPGDHR